MPTPLEPLTEDVRTDETPEQEFAWQIAGTNAQRARIGLPPLPALLAAGFDESEHPRGPDGRWIYKSLSLDEASDELVGPELSADQHAALDRYTMDPRANFLLRDEADGTIHKDAEAAQTRADITSIDAAIAQTSVPRPITVFRGTTASVFADVKAGEVFTDPGYVSTSIEKHTADEFTDLTSSWSGDAGANIQIDVPAGEQGLYLAPYDINEMAQQSEFLLPRGSQFHVESVHGSVAGKPMRVHLTLMGHHA